ncbi:MAG: hypothetical protein ABIH52_03885, partial [Candidatus Aenigmatarchaeota archaeon]
ALVEQRENLQQQNSNMARSNENLERLKGEYEEDIENTLDEQKAAQDKQINEMRWSDHWASGYDTYKTAMSFGRAAMSISNMFNPDSDWGGYSKSIDKAFATLNDLEHFEDELCKSGIIGSGSTENLIINNVNGRVQSGAHIEGYREGPYTDMNGRQVYNYLITGAVVPLMENFNSPFNVEIRVKGAGTRTVVLFEGIVVKDDNDQVISYTIRSTDYFNLDENNNPTKDEYKRSDGIVFDFNSLTQIKMQGETKKYTEVCIKFLSNPDNYFNEVMLDNNEMCNDIAGGE